MRHAALFRDLLEQADIAGVRRLLPEIMPQFPAPKTDAEVEATLHMARTACGLLDLSKRAWSHAWLTERNLPSQLPDALRPEAERMYPRVVDAVGISVNTANPLRKEFALGLRGAMEYAVEEMYADGVKDPSRVAARMQDAKATFYRKA